MVKDSKTLVIKNKKGKVLDVTLMNEKAFNKSTENAILWYLHPETFRVLPYGEESSFKDLIQSENFYEVTLLLDDSKEDETQNSNTSEGVSKEDEDLASFIISLSDLIKKRKEELPEGSYTSHLFNSGLEKIRKKTGEEAIELILANKKDEVIYESADLIYHMLVLLTELDIDIKEVLLELKNRES